MHVKIKDIGIGEKVEVLFDPCNLIKVFVYYKGIHHSTVQAYKMTRELFSNIPEEKKKSLTQISTASQQYFESIRKKHRK